MVDALTVNLMPHVPSLSCIEPLSSTPVHRAISSCFYLLTDLGRPVTAREDAHAPVALIRVQHWNPAGDDHTLQVGIVNVVGIVLKTTFC